MQKKKPQERVKVKKPPEEMLKLYYSLWVGGANNETIRSALGITKNFLKKHEPAFHEYCRQTAAVATRKSLASEGAPTEIALTAARREKFLQLVGNGATPQKAASMLLIPYLTVTEVWFRQDATLKQELETISDKHDLEVVEAIRRSACGYEYDAEECHDEEGVDGRGMPYDKHRKVTKKVRVTESAASQKLWVINRLGWSDTPREGVGDDEQVEYDIREQLYEEEQHGDE